MVKESELRLRKLWNEQAMLMYRMHFKDLCGRRQRTVRTVVSLRRKR